ncbi:MAG: HEPN domain-containing protein [Patescibacteria group bacterium]
MKNSFLNARRWLRQAEYDFEQAEKSFDDKSYAYAAFFSEQSAQKSLKAALFKSGKRAITIHSIAELAKEAAAVADKSFAELVESGARLDRHYLAARYPDALPEPATPFESYVEQDAAEAIAFARKILSAAKKFVER